MMASDEKKFERVFTQPEPQKRVLKKSKANFKDKEGRSYYAIEANESLESQTVYQRAAETKCIPMWVMLPPKATMGAMPEDFIVEAVTGMKFFVVERSPMKGRKQRGTGWVLLRKM